MMRREGAVKLIDFGIATQSGTRDSSLTGKPAYMAPEMVVELRADNRSDLFSLGAVLFEILTLERLFQGKTTAEVLEQVIAGQHPSPRTFNPAIPDGVMAIVRTALQRDPTRRYASAGEMGQACEHFLYDKGYGPTNLPLTQYLHALFPHPPSPRPRARPPGRPAPRLPPNRAHAHPHQRRPHAGARPSRRARGREAAGGPALVPGGEPAAAATRRHDAAAHPGAARTAPAADED